MKLEVKGRTALVTGSTKGIGKAIAFELAKEGVHVLVHGRSRTEAERVAAEIKAAYPESLCRAAAADLVDPEQRAALLRDHPAVDMLIHSMGVYGIQSYEETSEEEWEQYVRTNVLAANALTKHYLPGMKERGFGRILFIASEEAVMPSGQMPAYAMTKTMLLSLARSLSRLTAGTDVTVNTILPGPTMTEKVSGIIEGLYAGEELTLEEKERRFMSEVMPQSELGRFLRPAEIGRLVAFLCSPHASPFRGSPIRMDGGLVPTIF
ncbi:SDR family oxidoreductase [Paenibacillus albicereus]|uniref:SDR family oxidoreductase n=1 Tax=Paenibacillus albicereus TaxID=2726185 RepID=A0A6H2H171_9BACL|nr:SDR family oxidoreductase [Paenibacillus albicereus]QJC53166.1 SDR family oxidoreductase [Paenibacillus albicereus]